MRQTVADMQTQAATELADFPDEIAPFLPWNITAQRRQSLALDPQNTS